MFLPVLLVFRQGHLAHSDIDEGKMGTIVMMDDLQRDAICLFWPPGLEAPPKRMVPVFLSCAVFFYLVRI